MTSALVVRVYNVLFGDAILVSIPEKVPGGNEVVRHLLIDVGNLASSSDAVFDAVVTDIVARTGGVVDLYVMTHEHLDHTQGLLAAKRSGIEVRARHAWLTSSAAPDYYDPGKHDASKKQRLDDQQAYLDVVAQHSAGSDPWLEAMVRNNSALLPEGALGLKTSDYVDHLRTIAPAANTHYVDRSTALAGTHPFTEAKLRVLAPEEDTSVYYGRRRAAARFTAADAAASPVEAGGESQGIVPPVGIDAGAFFDLVKSRRKLNRQTIMQIDAAANNTSIVLEIVWRGWRLLFPGDAEEASWQMMRDKALLRPVHFVKVSHHGSVNGTVSEALDVVLPARRRDRRIRRAVVSVHDGDWDSVPSTDILDLYRHRVELFDTRDIEPGTAIEVSFAG